MADFPRIVVTGVGMVTPLGLDAPSSWKALLAGTSGTHRIDPFDPRGVRRAGRGRGPRLRRRRPHGPPHCAPLRPPHPVRRRCRARGCRRRPGCRLTTRTAMASARHRQQRRHVHDRRAGEDHRRARSRPRRPADGAEGRPVQRRRARRASAGDTRPEHQRQQRLRLRWRRHRSGDEPAAPGPGRLHAGGRQPNR